MYTIGTVGNYKNKNKYFVPRFWQEVKTVFHAFIMNKNDHVSAPLQSYKNKTYPSNGDCKYYYLIIKLCITIGTVGNYKRA